MFNPDVPVAPAVTNAMWISHASILIFIGIVIVLLAALPPVRRMAAKATDQVLDLLVPRKLKTTAVPSATEADPASQEKDAAEGNSRPAEVRREIEEFDLSLFRS